MARAARERLYAVAEAQAGYFTAGQALAAGYSHAAQSYHVKAGNWLREGWGVYRLARFPLVPGAKLVRLMLWSRDRVGEVQAAVSHDSALAVYGLSDVLPAVTHLSVPPGFRKAPPTGVALHRARLAAGEVTLRDGYRVTTPLRTLLDVAASPLSAEHLGVAVAQALAWGLVRERALRAALAAAPEVVRARLAPFVDRSASGCSE